MIMMEMVGIGIGKVWTWYWMGFEAYKWRRMGNEGDFWGA